MRLVGLPRSIPKLSYDPRIENDVAPDPGRMGLIVCSQDALLASTCGQLEKNYCATSRNT